MWNVFNFTNFDDKFKNPKNEKEIYTHEDLRCVKNKKLINKICYLYILPFYKYLHNIILSYIYIIHIK